MEAIAAKGRKSSGFLKPQRMPVGRKKRKPARDRVSAGREVEIAAGRTVLAAAEGLHVVGLLALPRRLLQLARELLVARLHDRRPGGLQGLHHRLGRRGLVCGIPAALDVQRRPHDRLALGPAPVAARRLLRDDAEVFGRLGLLGHGQTQDALCTAAVSLGHAPTGGSGPPVACHASPNSAAAVAGLTALMPSPALGETCSASFLRCGTVNETPSMGVPAHAPSRKAAPAASPCGRAGAPSFSFRFLAGAASSPVASPPPPGRSSST